MQISRILSCCILIGLPCVVLAKAQPIQQQEDKIIQASNTPEEEQFKLESKAKLIQLIQKNPMSFDANFQKSIDHDLVRIHQSPDHEVKFYTFDLRDGGTMGNSETLIQYKHQRVYTQKFQAGYINDVKQVTLNTKPVYLVQSFYKADSCSGIANLRAFTLEKNGVKKAPIFKGQSKAVDEISVEFDCKYDKSNGDRPSEIRISPDLKNIDILLVNKNGVPQNKYLRYVKDQTKFIYQGIVK